MEQTDGSQRLFSGLDLRRLIIPLVLEQILAITVGMADVIMVSSVGEAAVSGVTLVDMINQLIINIFAALGTGGAVVTAQMLGAREPERASQSAKQLLFIVTALSLIVMALTLVFRAPVLCIIYGSIDADVMQNALTYFLLSAFSYPFLAIYNAGAALFRAQGNSRISMLIALIVNIINISGNAFFIFGLHFGVAGAALSTLISRAIAAVVITLLLRRPENKVSLSKGGKFRLDGGLVGRILNIGIPNGIENSMFQLGRILVVSFIAGFGTMQIAANAVANNLDSLGTLPGQAMNLAMITVIGRCVGAGSVEQTKYYAKKLLKITYAIMIVFDALILLSLPLVLQIYHLSPETMRLSMQLIIIHNGCAMFIWPLSFTMPNVLRAASDVRYTMMVSVLSMWLFRCGFGYFLGVTLQWGALGVWAAMILDWIFRSLLFTTRYRGKKWLQHQISS